MRWIAMVAFCAVLAPSLASACGNEVRLSKSDEVKAIVKAEAHLEKRQYRRAVRVLMGAYGHGPMANRGVSGDRGLRQRVRHIGALVAVRSRGAISLRFWDAAKVTGNAATQQLRWAVRQLKLSHTDKSNYPAQAGHYAEALAAVGKPAEALAILEPLAKADLIVDAETWRVLADLRAAQGDQAGKATATTRCEASAIDKAVCRPTG